ncbi:MAG: helix-turn-helix transcriptional regulator [Clostridiaceae bacterium]|nr:helix-turn-helix transcriptional regulator [Clostridiaceae bacterium]
MLYDYKAVGQRIKSARNAKPYTQDYVSSKANIGEKFLSQVECGKAGLSVNSLVEICSILEVSSDYILFGNTHSKSDPISKLLKKLSPKQLNAAEELLKIFVNTCTDK